MRKLLIAIILFCLISVTFIVDNEPAQIVSSKRFDTTSTPMLPPLMTPHSRVNDTWQMFSHDINHTSNTTSGAPITTNVLWSNITGSIGEIYSSPIISDGRVFVGTRSSYLYCFDEETGEKLWARYFTRVSWGVCGSATCVNGNVYIGSEDNNIHCLNPINGNTIWKYPTGGAVYSCAAVVGGRVYVGSVDRYLYCLNEATGNLIWKYETNRSSYGYQDYGISSSPVVTNNRLFFGACDGNLTCLPLNDPNSDGLINHTEKYWEFDTGCYIYASPTVYDGKVYIGTGSYSKMAGAPAIYKIFCLDETTGNKIWEYTAGSYILGTPSIAYDKLYIGSLDGKLYCLPATDPDSNGIISESEVIWKFDAKNELWGSVTIAQERVYFGSGVPYWESGNGDYRVYCLPINDPNKDGIISSSEVIWSYKMNGGVLTSPAIVNDKLFISTYDGYVYCFKDDVIPPKINATTPKNDAVDVSLDIEITVKFNEAINSSTLTTSTFVVEDHEAKKVAGDITYNSDQHKAIFDPGSELDEYQIYTVTLNSDIQDLWGHGLDCDGDGIFEAEDEYTWSFTTTKIPPVIAKIPTQHPIEGEDWYLNMSLYVTDPNTPFTELTITENSSYANVNGLFIVFNYPNGIFTEHVNVSVSDGISSVWQDVLVMIKLTNNPPVISTIPEIHAIEDIDKSLDISPYVTDIDNELVDLQVRVNSSYAVVDGMVITFNYPNGISKEMVNITADDGDKIGFQHVNVIVTAVNDAPRITTVPDQMAQEDTDLVLNITKYISDIDNSVDELSVSTNSSYARVERVGGDQNGFLHIIFNYTEGILFENVNIIVTDSEKFAYGQVNVTVDPVNDPPTIAEIPVQHAIEDIDLVLDLSKYVTDVDTPLENLWSSLDSDYLIKADGLSFTLNYPNGVLEDHINLSLNDGIYTVLREFKVIITPKNDHPILSSGVVRPTKGDISTELTFTVIYTDIDGDDTPKVEVIIGENAYEMAKEDSNGNGKSKDGIKYEYKTKLSKGTHNYYFQCDDNSGGPNNTYTTESASIKITEPSTKASDTSIIVTASIAIIVIIAVILIIIVLWMMQMKKRKLNQDETPEPASIPTRVQPMAFTETQKTNIGQIQNVGQLNENSEEMGNRELK